MSPGFAPRNLFDALADAKSAPAESEISFGVPVVPDVPMIIAARDCANSEAISPKPRVGPAPARAAVMSLAN